MKNPFPLGRRTTGPVFGVFSNARRRGKFEAGIMFDGSRRQRMWLLSGAINQYGFRLGWYWAK